MMDATYTPGPWRWELNELHKNLQLVGGKPMFDLTIIEPTRWGMGSATLLVRDTAQDGFNILHKLHERRDWIEPFPGRKHHADWCQGVRHPDMNLIEAAPDLLEALLLMEEHFRGYEETDPYTESLFSKARSAIAKALGRAA